MPYHALVTAPPNNSIKYKIIQLHDSLVIPDVGVWTLSVHPLPRAGHVPALSALDAQPCIAHYKSQTLEMLPITSLC